MRMTRKNPDGKTYRAPEVNVRVEKGRCYDTYFGEIVDRLGKYEDLADLDVLQSKESRRYYKGIFLNAGKIVSEQEAFEYAVEHLQEVSSQDKREFVEWFFSGDWVEKEDKKCHNY